MIAAILPKTIALLLPDEIVWLPFRQYTYISYVGSRRTYSMCQAPLKILQGHTIRPNAGEGKMQLANFAPMVVMLAAAAFVQAGPIAADGASSLLLAAREPKCQVIPP